jgi:hypothetical protein
MLSMGNRDRWLSKGVTRGRNQCCGVLIVGDPIGTSGAYTNIYTKDINVMRMFNGHNIS